MKKLLPSLWHRFSRRILWLSVAAVSTGFVTMGVLKAIEPVPGGKPSHYPAWWFERGVIKRTDLMESSPVWPDDYPVADDYAAINLGQLKTVASKAALELDEKLIGGPGPAIQFMISTWQTPTEQTDDFVVANLGQLKNVAKPFYDRLIEERYLTDYPWSGPADNFAAANIGQLKHVFRFDIDTTDSDTDGLPDWWEQQWIDSDSGDAFVDLTDIGIGDSDADGVSDEDEYLLGRNPTKGAQSGTTGDVNLKVFTLLE